MAVPKRLSKIARELNVGISTIVEFLESKNVEVEANPNTKISTEVYNILLEEFADEKIEKEKSEEISIKREVRETVALQSREEEKVEEPEFIETKVELSGPSVVGKIDLTPKKDKKEEVEEKVEEKKVEEVKEEKEEEVIKAKTAEPKKIEVLGKIDLEDTKKKKKTPKKTEPKPEPTQEPVKEKVEEKKVEEVVEKVVEEEPEVETIKAEAEKLTGPTVLGKIELPKEKTKAEKLAEKKEKQKEREERKTKRKRIKKVNVAKTVEKEKNKKRDNNKFNNNKKKPKTEISEEEIQKEIKETLARLSGGGKSKSVKNRRAKRQAQAERREEELLKQEEESKVLKITEFVTVSDLASLMSVAPTDIIGACMSLGIFASINQRLDAETISIIAEEYGYQVEFISVEAETEVEEEVEEEGSLEERPPIVTVMGHVDHGKTSLLDYIRNTKVTEGEAGGITQHIGAYSVTGESGRKITFLDTPGHEAFTAMRARGAKVTDVAIIIIAADDKIMPQTKEAINHAQAADVPMIFAINKVDKPGASADKIKEQLAAMNLLVEEWGGKYQSQDISAKTGQGIEELLEKVLLESDLLELKANPTRLAKGTIIESSLDKGRGYITTIIVEKGTLKVGDMVLAGQYYGKVKAMTDERGTRMDEAGPSTPAAMLGLNGAPAAGDKFVVMTDEKEVKQIATKRSQIQREQGVRTQKHITLDEIGRRLAIGDFQELNIIVKGDVDGSIEALSDSLLKLSTDNIQVNIIHKAVGAITESDVLLATASDAIIVGFQVRPTAGARKLAENEEIDIRLYSIIYQALEEVKAAMEGMLSPDIEEQIMGTAEIRETFKISKVGTIAGCFVLDGKINRNSNVRVIREGIVVYTGTLGSLKRFKDDVKEVAQGYECGLNVERYNDIKVGDIIEAFEEVEVAKKLS